MKATPEINQKVKLVSHNEIGQVFKIREGKNGTEIRVKYPNGLISEYASVVFYDEA